MNQEKLEQDLWAKIVDIKVIIVTMANKKEEAEVLLSIHVEVIQTKEANLEGEVAVIQEGVVYLLVEATQMREQGSIVHQKVQEKAIQETEVEAIIRRADPLQLDP